MSTKAKKTKSSLPSLEFHEWVRLDSWAEVKDRLRILEETTGGFWKQQDGTLIQIRQMSDNHLKNALRLLGANHGGNKRVTIQQMLKEQDRRARDKAWEIRTGNVGSSSVLEMADIRARLSELERKTKTVDHGPGKLYVNDEFLGRATKFSVTPDFSNPQPETNPEKQRARVWLDELQKKILSRDQFMIDSLRDIISKL